MSWLSSHTAEISAFCSICMNLATLIIILFNLNQFNLSRRSLNIEVNFKVFDLRKKIYRDTEQLIEELYQQSNFLFLFNKTNNTEDFSVSQRFEQYKDLLEDSKYLFSKSLFQQLERMLFMFETGISFEKEIQSIKAQDPDTWNAQTTKKIQDLTERKKEVIECIKEFDLCQFIPYLKISNFDKDFLSYQERTLTFKHKLLEFSKTIFLKNFKNKSQKKELKKSFS